MERQQSSAKRIPWTWGSLLWPGEFWLIPLTSISFCFGVVVSVLYLPKPAFQKHVENRLKLAGIGLHEMHDEHGRFPMAVAFRTPDGKPKGAMGHTPFQVIRGKDCVFDDAYPARRGARAVGLIGRPFGEIRDQGATTLSLAMAATPVPWTAPAVINADDREPIEPRFARRFRSHLGVTADGAFRQVGRDWGEERWRAFLRIQGPAPRWE